jgi:adenylate kinase
MVSQIKNSLFILYIFPYVVPDEIVIEIVKKRIVECEKECRHWIIEGFPRTKSQALAMEKIGIIPDKMIELKVSEE